MLSSLRTLPLPRAPVGAARRWLSFSARDRKLSKPLPRNLQRKRDAQRQGLVTTESKVKTVVENTSFGIYAVFAAGSSISILYYLFAPSSPQRAYDTTFDIVRDHPRVTRALGSPIKAHGSCGFRCNQIKSYQGEEVLQIEYYVTGPNGDTATVHASCKPESFFTCHVDRLQVQPMGSRKPLYLVMGGQELGKR